jgi:predicted membrane protein
MRTLLKTMFLVIGSVIVTRLAAYVVAQQFEEGSEVSDEFRRMVIFDGLDFASRAGGLRSGEVSVFLGGAKLDLREAVIDGAGARIHVENTLGGLAVTVRDDWAVTVNEMVVGGGEVEVRVTPLDELPEDAPKLELDIITRLGGTVVTTGSIDP